MDNPQAVSPGSIMPHYSWLLTQRQDRESLPARLNALRKIGVPYETGYENGPAQKDLEAQAATIVAKLKQNTISSDPDKEIIALIAYLQRLGADIKSAPVAAATK